jgi:iron-sulfur cluster repair protein YtfE (RIC family)
MQTAPGNDVVRPAALDQAPVRNTWKSVSSCLEHDHRVLDELVKNVDAFVQERDFENAAEFLKPFRARLETHIEAEETILFPLFELKTGCNGPTSVMRREHRDILRVMGALSVALAGCATVTDPQSLLAELRLALDSHNEKEERVLYPAIDGTATASGELDELVASVEAFLTRPAASSHA